MAIVSAPTTAIMLQKLQGMFYILQFNTIEINILLGICTAVGLSGDFLIAVWLGLLLYLHYRSTVHYLNLMK